MRNYLINPYFFIIYFLPMSSLIILAHPKPNSFNHVIAKKVVGYLHSKREDVFFHDLYKENFNPLLSNEELLRKASFDNVVVSYIEELTLSQCLIFIHPDWWGQPPAILKGWIDRVFLPGIAYEYQGPEFGKKRAVGLLNNKKIIVLCTSDQPTTDKTPLVQTLWENAIFPFCNIGFGSCLLFLDMYNSSFEQRTKWIDDLPQHLQNVYASNV